MALTLSIPASEAVVSLDEAKAWAEVEGESFDTVMELALDAAIAKVEELTERALGEQVWVLTLDAFADAIELARGPVTEVDSVRYYDAEGIQLVADPALYATDLVSTPAWVVLSEGESWPETLSAVNAVSVEFTVGYTAETLPASLKLAVLMLAATWFSDRESAAVPKSVLDLAAPFRRIRM